MPLRYTIEFESAFHLGSGHGIAGILDRALLRGADRVPFIPGSAIKGKFREAALRILCATQKNPCLAPGAEICKDDAGCTMCRLFGSAMRRGKAVFHDARPAGPEGEALAANLKFPHQGWLPGGTEVRTTTAIDRKRRVVFPQHLFSTETVSPIIRFEAVISGPLDDQEVELLDNSAGLLTFFGGSSSRGLGFCRVYRSAQ
ncbi:MAG: RAMP superfamily CRISPR-associated protein [Bryobacteraceae bacterium]|jgi:CRISPR/Cas system CSM-associated protein Csm3 (group 7 of RAMP superfamily)